MCLTCGCMEPDLTHNDERHITYEDFKKAAEAAEETVEEAKENLIKTLAIAEERSQG